MHSALGHLTHRGKALALDALVLHRLDHRGHVVELVAKLTELIARVHLNGVLELTLCIMLRTNAKSFHRLEHPAPKQQH